MGMGMMVAALAKIGFQNAGCGGNGHGAER